MNVYNDRVQDQVLSLSRRATTYSTWQTTYKKAIVTKYPRGRVLQRLARLELGKILEDNLGTVTGRLDSTKQNKTNTPKSI
jgi:hypothetical protein